MGAGICGVRWRKGFLPLRGVRFLGRPAGRSPSVRAWGAGASVSAGTLRQKGDISYSFLLPLHCLPLAALSDEGVQPR